MPSTPSSHAFANTSAPSPSIASLNMIAPSGLIKASSWARRASSGSLRTSSPSTLRRSNATKAVLAFGGDEEHAALAALRHGAAGKRRSGHDRSGEIDRDKALVDAPLAERLALAAPIAGPVAGANSRSV